MIRAAAVAALLAASPAFAGAQDPAWLRYYFSDVFEPFFAPDPADPARLRSRRPGSADQSFSARKPAGGVRVFLIGGSIARIALDGPNPGNLQSALEAALPGRAVEVVNCGMSGYDSYREALVEQEVLGYGPDALVLMTGHNEFLSSKPPPVWIAKASERLSRWKAYRALAGSLNHRPADRPERRAERDRAFAENLRRNLREAGRRGVAVAALEPPLNYRDGPADTPAPYREPDFLKGWLAYAAGDCPKALAAWRAAAPRGAGAALARFYGARCRDRARDPLAMAAYEQALAADDASARCGGTCRRTLRRLASEEGAVIAEADRAFREAALPAAPGLEHFDDLVHWKPRCIARCCANRCSPKWKRHTGQAN